MPDSRCVAAGGDPYALRAMLERRLDDADRVRRSKGGPVRLEVAPLEAGAADLLGEEAILDRVVDVFEERRTSMSCPGNRPNRCETCRWWISGACMSQSSSHSCSWPARPIWSGASLARVALHLACRSASVPSVRAALIALANSSRRISSSIVGPSVSDVPNGCAFSGDSDGDVTSQWCVGSSTSVSRKNWTRL